MTERELYFLDANNRSVHDAIHAATMLNNGLKTIISADKHFDAVPEIIRIDPVAVK